ncbi:MAG: hypothetical protein RL748_194 [Pseudomonadota bacterium]|jgi:hypothetical protein
MEESNPNIATPLVTSSHTEWLRNEVISSINDPAPRLSHDAACQKLDENLEKLRLRALESARKPVAA